MTVADQSSLDGASSSSSAGSAAPVVAGNSSAENPHTRGHSPARDNREQAAAAAAQAPPVDPKVAPDVPKQDPAKIKVGDLEMSEADLRDLMADKATRDSVKLSLPPSPEAYELKLPADFKGPEGVTFEFNKADPAVIQARQFAHRHGLSQAAFSELTGIYAGEKAQELAIFNAAKAAEVGKLGGAGTARVTAVTTWIRGMMGAEADALAGALDHAPVAKTVAAFETLMRKWSSQGAADFNQSHRAGQEDAGTIPNYDNMSFTQKRAAQMNQNRPSPRRGSSE